MLATQHGSPYCFNTQPPEGGCSHSSSFVSSRLFQHSAARRRLRGRRKTVSPKCSFNTQPPEGGCLITSAVHSLPLFQHSAARRRLIVHGGKVNLEDVSTLSRPKAAGQQYRPSSFPFKVSTLSRPKAAVDFLPITDGLFCVSTLSRPKAAGRLRDTAMKDKTFQHSAARRRLDNH